MMDRQQHSFGLHQLALRGDAEGFHKALEMGADINALDGMGRTVLMCAVAGERWKEIDASDASFITSDRLEVIQTIIEHPDVSLYTLNAPQSATNGVTPLGMAAWLNSPQAVQCLLDASRETVSVNGMDSHAATPLMYAARDGNMEVTRILLSHGARPDFRDRNHRTSVQFSMAHPQILWQCEIALRQHRLRESRHPSRIRLLPSSESILSLSESYLSACPKQLPLSSLFTKSSISQLTDSLVQSIHSSDSTSVQSLLFSSPFSPSSSSQSLHSPSSTPLLVNFPDRKGWSPIHHCASSGRLSVSILDALYCAGADVSLFTKEEHYTPLHCLACAARLCEEDPDPSLTLYQFAMHLIRDLQAPLSARDRNDETCIHIAAEHGSCIDLLMIFLECDTTGSIRELRNARGLTALEVAKPEFRVAFGDDFDKLRSVSSLSNRTVRALRPTASLTSIVSFSNRANGLQTSRDGDLSLVDNGDISLSTQQLIAHLRSTCPNKHQALDLGNIDALSETLRDSQYLGKAILQHYRSRAEDAAKDLHDIRAAVARVSCLLDKVGHVVDGELALRGLQPIRLRGGRFRDSQDSQVTAVASEDGEYVHVATDKSPLGSGNSSPVSSKPMDACSIAIQTACLDLIRSATKDGYGSAQRSPSFFRSLSSLGSTTAYPVRLATLVDEEQAILGAQLPEPTSTDVVKRCQTDEKGFDLFKRKLKSWFKKKHIETTEASFPRSKPRLTINTKLDGSTAMGDNEDPAPEKDVHTSLLDMPLRMSYVVLDAARKDLEKIDEVISAAEEFLSTANHSISRSERVIDRAIKKRQAAIETLQSLYSSTDPKQTPTHSNRSSYLVAPSPTSSLSSANSSCVSLAATLTENDDEDVRAIRRLLLRKIEASLGGSMDELSKVAEWLPLVKEAAASVKRRTCL